MTTTTDELVVEAALPGIKPDDVEITVENGTLTIRGYYREERREGEGEYLVRRSAAAPFSRSVSLPTGLEPDKATATFEHGVLTLRIPRAEEVKPRQIRISPTSKVGWLAATPPISRRASHEVREWREAACRAEGLTR